MANTIRTQAHPAPHALRQHTNKNLGRLAEKKADKSEASTSQVQDSVTISYHEEVTTTYSSSLTIQTGDEQDQYNLLRGLVTNMLKEQGIDFRIANGDQTIDINEISREEATQLIADDGYFGVEQTSERIVDFAIGMAGNDPSRLEAIKEGIEKAFNEALEAFGDWLPDISYDTHDAVMGKLDTWAEGNSPEQVSLAERQGNKMSVEFRGVGGLGQIGSINKTGKSQTDSKTGSTRESDQVQFSSVLQGVNKAQAGADENSARAERVTELKEQIANGSYAPDLNKVASSFLQFLMEDK